MATKKYDFKFTLTDLEEKAVLDDKQNEVIVSDQLANIFLNSNISDAPLKYFDWALELKKSGAITVDDTDRKLIQDFISSHPAVPLLTKGRILKVFLK